MRSSYQLWLALITICFLSTFLNIILNRRNNERRAHSELPIKPFEKGSIFKPQNVVEASKDDREKSEKNKHGLRKKSTLAVEDNGAQETLVQAGSSGADQKRLDEFLNDHAKHESKESRDKLPGPPSRPQSKISKPDTSAIDKSVEKEVKPPKIDPDESNSVKRHQLAGLSCEKYGGPTDDTAAEMVYWRDIPSDSNYKSPFYDEDKYLTFEPDHGGWNNIRMAMETILVMAHAMGRTLVLPPAQKLYLLNKDSKKHKTEFTFLDFFHLDSIGAEHPGLNIMTMEEFLTKVAMKGKLVDHKKGKPTRPPGDRVNWDGKWPSELWAYLRNVGYFPEWEPTNCIAAFPASKDKSDLKELQAIMEHINTMETKPEDYVGKPVPVDAPTIERLKENLATRKKLCVYDEAKQKPALLHIYQGKTDSRMLVPFYSFVFFQDWKQDLWTKRFIRDHVRYIDEIMCAAARVVHAVRQRARIKHPGNSSGHFDSIHVRRGDFQFKPTRLDADILYNQSKDRFEEGGVLYIATDERDKAFFKPFAKHYDICFLDDFKDLLKGINTNYYGMLDQLVASRGEAFFGTWWSTFSSYINRMRGYHVSNDKSEGFDDGTMKSWYFNPDGYDRRNEMRVYWPIRQPIYMREFPTSWRNIDFSLD